MFLCVWKCFISNHCCTDPSVVSMLLTVAFELESADCEAAALLFSFCDSSFAEGGRRMHMAAWPSRMTFGLEINPTITPICCTISSRVVSCGKRKMWICVWQMFTEYMSGVWQLSFTLLANNVKSQQCHLGKWHQEKARRQKEQSLTDDDGVQLQTSPTLTEHVAQHEK